ncbi:cytosolic thiouridylase subunit 2 isoform X1 [Choristoneura fumiferana]|uniref:cytosolic thiouridylase subunit 2 isoform X1 n=1 Tax=Choristoneura fumiferana TaxID=7141 RepID=UPI003D15CE36
MNCKKCDISGTVVLRRKDYYCGNCFITNINHKFRACIGKNRAISPHEKVLVCLSGGRSSTVLLDMIYNGITISNHKKLRMTPFFLHLIDNNKNSEQIANTVVRQCKQYDFEVFMIHMSEYVSNSTNLPEPNSIPANNYEAELQAMLGSMTATVRNDFVVKIRRHLSIRIAEQLQCHFIFTAETTATLAINLLSNLTVGRGAQVQDDVSFCDARDGKVKILRPMKDISKEELIYYIKINNLNPIDQIDVKENSLQSVIGTFVTELQDSFQATISTICKTADKIGTDAGEETNQQCVLCECDLRMKNNKLTALDATNFSKMVSERSNNIHSNNDKLENLGDQESMKSMFPFINERLCYGCSRNYLEMDHCKLPCYIQKTLQS